MNLLGLILANACIHGISNWWMTNTLKGREFKTFIQTWRTDSLLHLILCGGTVFIYSCLAILLLGLTLRELGI
jgi:hypothetical protein